MKRIKIIAAVLMLCVSALLAQPEALVINTETADEAMLFIELTINTTNYASLEVSGYFQPVRAYSCFEVEEDNNYSSDNEILLPVGTSSSLWGNGENNQIVLDPDHIQYICTDARKAIPATNPKYRGTKTSFEETLVKYAGTTLETPREERTKIVTEFWNHNYLKMKCKEESVYPEGGLLRQMAFECFMPIFKMVDAWGYNLDFSIVEDDGMNIVDWIDYMISAPEEKRIRANDHIAEQQIPCLKLFREKMIGYGVKPTGNIPPKQ